MVFVSVHNSELSMCFVKYIERSYIPDLENIKREFILLMFPIWFNFQARIHLSCGKDWYLEKYRKNLEDGFGLLFQVPRPCHLMS